MIYTKIQYVLEALDKLSAQTEREEGSPLDVVITTILPTILLDLKATKDELDKKSKQLEKLEKLHHELDEEMRVKQLTEDLLSYMRDDWMLRGVILNELRNHRNLRSLDIPDILTKYLEKM